MLDGVFDDNKYKNVKFIAPNGYSIYTRSDGDVFDLCEDGEFSIDRRRKIQAVYWVKNGEAEISVPVGLPECCCVSTWKFNVERLIAKILYGEVDFSDYKVESHSIGVFKYLTDYYVDSGDSNGGMQKGLSIWLREKILRRIREKQINSSELLKESIRGLGPIEDIFYIDGVK